MPQNPGLAPNVSQPGLPQLAQASPAAPMQGAQAPQQPTPSSMGPSNPMPAQQPGDPEITLILKALSDYLKFKQDSQQAPDVPMGLPAVGGGMGSSGYKPMG